MPRAVPGERRRPAFVARPGGQLERVGFTEVYGISEGMNGSNFGPGWLARGLPLSPCVNC